MAYIAGYIAIGLFALAGLVAVYGIIDIMIQGIIDIMIQLDKQDKNK